MLSEFAALGAALCWAIGSLFSVAPVNEMGPFAYVRIRMTVVIGVMLGWLVLTGQLQQSLLAMPIDHITLLLISGLIGIWFGDVMIFTTLRRLGPRRSGMLFAINAPIQVLLGALFLSESMTWLQVGGTILVITGTFFAIAYGKRASQVHHWEHIKGSLMVGVMIGLGSALGQAVGALIAKPVMDAGTSPVAATIVRAAAAVFMLWLSLGLRLPQQRTQCRMTPRLWFLTSLSSLISMALGMSLLLYAMGTGDLGITAVLSSITPVLFLPLLWWRTREMPSWGAWLGAILAVVGIALLQ